MKRWRLRPKAQSDLDEIAAYTARQWGRRQANLYLNRLKGGFDQLVRDRWRGGPVNPDRFGLFKFHIGSHHIIFTRGGERVEIVRILHERMDLDTQLNS